MKCRYQDLSLPRTLQDELREKKKLVKMSTKPCRPVLANEGIIVWNKGNKISIIRLQLGFSSFLCSMRSFLSELWLMSWLIVCERWDFWFFFPWQSTRCHWTSTHWRWPLQKAPDLSPQPWLKISQTVLEPMCRTVYIMLYNNAILLTILFFF